MKALKHHLLILSAMLALCGCSEKADKDTFSKVKEETASYSFSEHDNIKFQTKPDAITADEVYTLTMKKVKNEQATESDAERMKTALAKLFDIPEEDYREFNSKVRAAGDAFVTYKELYSASVYPNCSTFSVISLEALEFIPGKNPNFTNYDLYNYQRHEYPTEALRMADGSTLTADKAVTDAERYIKALSEAQLFDEGETVKLSRIAVNHTENGDVLTLHYNQVRFGLEVDDGGCMITGEDREMMRNPYFEITFAGDDRPFRIHNDLSDGVMEKVKLESIIGLSEAEKILGDSVASKLNARVSEAALRYCCIHRDETESHEYRPMWCFTVYEYKNGATAMTPFPRTTYYVDALSGGVYYCDSQRFIFEKQ